MHTLRRNSRRPHGGTIIDIAFAIILVGLLALGILWLCKAWGQATHDYGQAMITASQKASAIHCQMNMRSIEQCIQAHLLDYDDLPSSREELIRICGGESGLFRCDEPNGLPYAYVAGQRPDMPGSNVLVYEPAPVHQGQSTVLFLSGRVDMLDPNSLQRALTETKSQILRKR
jgi:hypothetical protein